MRRQREKGSQAMITATPRTMPRKKKDFIMMFYLKFHIYLNLLSAPVGLKTFSNLKCNTSVQFQKKKATLAVMVIEFSKTRRTWSFHDAVLQKTTPKCTTIKTHVHSHRSGSGCPKSGLRHPPDKSLSSGKHGLFC